MIKNISTRKKWFINKLEISHGNHSPLRPMEGLRGFAVFLVFLVHYCSLFQPYMAIGTLSESILFILKNTGNIGVDLFFVLSGFLIYGTLITKHKTHFLLYFKRRFIRIYPTFLFVFLVYLILSVLIPTESKLPIDGLDKLLYVIQNLLLLPGIFEIPAIITVAWSLSYEVFYYITIPLILALIKMRTWKFQQRIIFWFVVSIMGFSLFEFFGDSTHYTRLLMFISGIILYETYTQKLLILPKFFGTFCLISALILYYLAPNVSNISTLSVILLYVLFFFLCLEAFSSKQGTATWLNFSPLRWLGNMSYSYYLMHGLTLKALFFIMAVFIPATQQFNYVFWFVLPIFFIITVMSSFVLYVFVEKPFSIDKKHQ
jgi:exopolysaccharide production protein ExoZ